jgi:NAD(P)H-dependent FMN reductase
VRVPLIAYHSQSGASAALAFAAARGAACDAAPVRCLRAVDAGAGEVAAAAGLLLVCAENSGRLAGGAKDFLDRIFYPMAGRGVLLPYALLISAGTDGNGAVAEARRIFRGIPFTEALEPRIIRGRPDGEALRAAEEFGEAFATGLSMGIF